MRATPVIDGCKRAAMETVLVRTVSLRASHFHVGIACMNDSLEWNRTGGAGHGALNLYTERHNTLCQTMVFYL